MIIAITIPVLTDVIPHPVFPLNFRMAEGGQRLTDEVDR